jgi:hypothetical protein
MKTSIRQCHTVGALVLALGLNVACTDQAAPQTKIDEQSASPAAGAPPDSQVGVVPAGPGKEAPATTSAVKSDVSKAQQSSAMPMPGQANDHSTSARTPSMKPVNAAP